MLLDEVVEQFESGCSLPGLLGEIVGFDEDHECVEVVSLADGEVTFTANGESRGGAGGLLVLGLGADSLERELADEFKVVIGNRGGEAVKFS